MKYYFQVLKNDQQIFCTTSIDFKNKRAQTKYIKELRRIMKKNCSILMYEEPDYDGDKDDPIVIQDEKNYRQAGANNKA